MTPRPAAEVGPAQSRAIKATTDIYRLYYGNNRNESFVLLLKGRRNKRRRGKKIRRREYKIYKNAVTAKKRITRLYVGEKETREDDLLLKKGATCLVIVQILSSLVSLSPLCSLFIWPFAVIAFVDVLFSSESVGILVWTVASLTVRFVRASSSLYTHISHGVVLYIQQRIGPVVKIKTQNERDGDNRGGGMSHKK